MLPIEEAVDMDEKFPEIFDPHMTPEATSDHDSDSDSILLDLDDDLLDLSLSSDDDQDFPNPPVPHDSSPAVFGSTIVEDSSVTLAPHEMQTPTFSVRAADFNINTRPSADRSPPPLYCHTRTLSEQARISSPLVTQKVLTRTPSMSSFQPRENSLQFDDDTDDHWDDDFDMVEFNPKVNPSNKKALAHPYPILETIRLNPDLVAQPIISQGESELFTEPKTGVNERGITLSSESHSDMKHAISSEMEALRSFDQEDAMKDIERPAVIKDGEPMREFERSIVERESPETALNTGECYEHEKDLVDSNTIMASENAELGDAAAAHPELSPSAMEESRADSKLHDYKVDKSVNTGSGLDENVLSSLADTTQDIGAEGQGGGEFDTGNDDFMVTESISSLNLATSQQKAMFAYPKIDSLGQDRPSQSEPVKSQLSQHTTESATDQDHSEKSITDPSRDAIANFSHSEPIASNLPENKSNETIDGLEASFIEEDLVGSDNHSSGWPDETQEISQQLINPTSHDKNETNTAEGNLVAMVLEDQDSTHQLNLSSDNVSVEIEEINVLAPANIVGEPLSADHDNMETFTDDSKNEHAHADDIEEENGDVATKYPEDPCNDQASVRDSEMPVEDSVQKENDELLVEDPAEKGEGASPVALLSVDSETEKSMQEPVANTQNMESVGQASDIDLHSIPVSTANDVDSLNQHTNVCEALPKINKQSDFKTEMAEESGNKESTTSDELQSRLKSDSSDRSNQNSDPELLDSEILHPINDSIKPDLTDFRDKRGSPVSEKKIASFDLDAQAGSNVFGTENADNITQQENVKVDEADEDSVNDEIDHTSEAPSESNVEEGGISEIELCVNHIAEHDDHHTHTEAEQSHQLDEADATSAGAVDQKLGIDSTDVREDAGELNSSETSNSQPESNSTPVLGLSESFARHGPLAMESTDTIDDIEATINKHFGLPTNHDPITPQVASGPFVSPTRRRAFELPAVAGLITEALAVPAESPLAFQDRLIDELFEVPLDHHNSEVAPHVQYTAPEQEESVHEKPSLGGAFSFFGSLLGHKTASPPTSMEGSPIQPYGDLHETQSKNVDDDVPISENILGSFENIDLSTDADKQHDIVQNMHLGNVPTDWNGDLDRSGESGESIQDTYLPHEHVDSTHDSVSRTSPYMDGHPREVVTREPAAESASAEHELRVDTQTPQKSQSTSMDIVQELEQLAISDMGANRNNGNDEKSLFLGAASKSLEDFMALLASSKTESTNPPNPISLNCTVDALEQQLELQRATISKLRDENTQLKLERMDLLDRIKEYEQGQLCGPNLPRASVEPQRPITLVTTACPIYTHNAYAPAGQERVPHSASGDFRERLMAWKGWQMDMRGW